MAHSNTSKNFKKFGCFPKTAFDAQACGIINREIDYNRRTTMESCPKDPKCILYTTTENGHEIVSCKASKEEDQKHCQAYNDEFRKFTIDGFRACTTQKNFAGVPMCYPKIG